MKSALPWLMLAALATVALAQTPPNTPAAPPAAPRAPDLTLRISRAADRIAAIDAQAGRIEDYNALRNLQRTYGYYYDEALWDQIVDLFADDATVEVGQNGVYAGKASIRRYFYGLTGNRQGLVTGELNNQLQLSPVITVSADGQSAQAHWRVWMQDGVYMQSANWGSGAYENDYVKQAGVWKIKSLHLFVRFYAPYEGGWTRTTAQLNARYGKSSAKADRPPSVRYDTWPTRFTAPMHFAATPADYRLAPENAAQAPAPTETTPRTVAGIEAQVRALELKLQRLRAVDQVENLQGSYGYYVDMSMADPTASLFSDSATLEILGRGIYVGRDRIYEYMRRLGLPAPGRMFTHMQLQPVITVAADGQSADIRARLFEMFGAYNSQAQWAEGTYENHFVLDHGTWKYQNLIGYQTFYTPYEAGWGKQSNPLMNYYPGYPPDLPHSIEYQPYPAVFVPPFHYKNPVSGK